MELSFQTGVAFGMLAIVVVYLTNRFVVKPLTKEKSDHDCGSDCNCG